MLKMNSLYKSDIFGNITNAAPIFTNTALGTTQNIPKVARDNITISQMDAIAFLKTLPTESIDLIITDPAYS